MSKESVLMACRYYLAQLNKRGSRTHLVNLYGIEDIEEIAPSLNSYGSTAYLPAKEDGFCEQFAMKMDRTLKELTTRNIYQ